MIVALPERIREVTSLIFKNVMLLVSLCARVHYIFLRRVVAV
jgi:hypothetical protein